MITLLLLGISSCQKRPPCQVYSDKKTCSPCTRDADCSALNGADEYVCNLQVFEPNQPYCKIKTSIPPKPKDETKPIILSQLNSWLSKNPIEIFDNELKYAGIKLPNTLWKYELHKVDNVDTIAADKSFSLVDLLSYTPNEDEIYELLFYDEAKDKSFHLTLRNQDVLGEVMLPQDVQNEHLLVDVIKSGLNKKSYELDGKMFRLQDLKNSEFNENKKYQIFIYPKELPSHYFVLFRDRDSFD